jgi:hypothetical protein
MPETPRVTIRLSKIQRDQLAQLARKLQIDQSNVMRLAIARLAEQEGILVPMKRHER